MMDDEYDTWDAREANERADEEYERTKNFAEVQWVPTAREGGGFATFQCERCGCLVVNIDQHRFNCGGHVGDEMPKIWGRIAEITRTLGSRVQGDQWPTVSDRLNWMARRLEAVAGGFENHQGQWARHNTRGPSDAPGGPEHVARAQRTLDDDWAGLGGIGQEVSKRLGQAIDRFLGEKK